MAYKSSPRGSRPVSLAGVHSAEGARTARSLASYFYRPDIAASAHACIDANETLLIVPYDRAAWTMRSGNPISDNVELCGFARWSREQWLSTGSVDGCANPRGMLDRLAAWLSDRIRARGLNVKRLAVVELQRGHWGVIAHDDWTKAFKDGSHWDPGPGFPWDYVMGRVSGANVNVEDDVSAAEVWSEPLASWTGYSAPAREWLVAANGKLEAIGPAVAAGFASTSAQLSTIAAAVSDGDLDASALGTRLEKATREAAEAGSYRAVQETVIPAIQQIKEMLANDQHDDARTFIAELLTVLSTIPQPETSPSP